MGRQAGTGKFSFPLPADLEQDWQPYPVGLCSAESSNLENKNEEREKAKYGTVSILLTILSIIPVYSTTVILLKGKERRDIFVESQQYL